VSKKNTHGSKKKKNPKKTSHWWKRNRTIEASDEESTKITRQSELSIEKSLGYGKEEILKLSNKKLVFIFMIYDN
jgi:hypothetical protein